MAKETMIVFVYDTECCQRESDDPVDAVLYFHPSWVSDVQKLSLCGQLMGTVHFLNETFFKPKIISLQSGKFILKEFGRFILAVGTDRNLPASLLEHRANLLASLVKLFHRDIQTIHDQFPNNGQYKNLSEKLYHIFETYLPILQYNGNVFQNVPTLRLPKSASNIFLDAIQTLQSCQQNKGVLGGTILYHNKVVATQLSPEITKNLVLTDPYRIKSTAEPVNVDFYVPIGVQLIVVYISNKDYRKLIHDAQKAQSVVTQSVSHSIITHQFPKRKMKRDKSLIFTNIPEEGTCDQPPVPPVPNGNIRSKPNMNRPNHLPLKFKNVTTREVPESGIASINFDETDSYPEFIGRTSVCSTPMTENKILHGHVMSICANPVENLLAEDRNLQNASKTEPDLNEAEEADKATAPNTPQLPSRLDFNNFFSNFVRNPQTFERRNSFTDIQDTIKKMTKRFTFRSFSFGFGSFGKDESGTPDFVDDIENRKTCKTIADPTYPAFNSEGGPISKSLFQEFLDSYYKSCDEDIRNDAKIGKFVTDFREFDGDTKAELGPKTDEANAKDETFILDSGSLGDIVNKSNRKSLTLPLKPLNDDQTGNNSGIFERKKVSGIQLTPLMTKLSILASNDERSSGFGSWDTTPGIEVATPLDALKSRRKSSLKLDDTAASNLEEGYRKVELYVCGQQNMTLLLLIEEGAGKKQELVQAMFDICVSKLGRLEINLNQTLNVNVDGDKGEGGYSYICVDPKWDTMQRGGPWSPTDLISLENLHRDLRRGTPVTDILIRTDDSVIYGYKCGRKEVYYKQSSHPQNGLPPPADTMGTISLRAKRRLERDHSFILF